MSTVLTHAWAVKLFYLFFSPFLSGLAVCRLWIPSVLLQAVPENVFALPKRRRKKKSAHPREQHMLIAGSLSTYPRLEQMATSRLFSRPSPNMLMRRDGRCVWEERISGSVYLSLLVWLDWFLSWRAISISPINDNLIHISTHGVPCSTGGTCPK